MNSKLQPQYLFIKNKFLPIINNNSDLNNINPKNICTILTYVISTIDKYSNSNITGSDKKYIAYNIIHDIIEEKCRPEYKDFILNILDNIFDTYIENIIDVSKGKFIINKSKGIFDVCKKCINYNSTL